MKSRQCKIYVEAFINTQAFLTQKQLNLKFKNPNYVLFFNSKIIVEITRTHSMK